jgi:D-amino peptidase
MRVYVSADIEGITGICHWDETEKGKPDYAAFAEQMTAEVAAACRGAVAAGAKEILVKDAHGTGRNIKASALPECVRISRGWNGHPYSMMQELDESFDAAVMVGYHSEGGSAGSPLSHTLVAPRIHRITVNGERASEFLLNAYTAALVGVPVVFVSGDEELCENVRNKNANIRRLAVNRGTGASVVSMHPGLAVKRTEEEVKAALAGDLKKCAIGLPSRFAVELRFVHHFHAYRASFYPGVEQVSPRTARYETNEWFEVLRMLQFVAWGGDSGAGAPA